MIFCRKLLFCLLPALAVPVALRADAPAQSASPGPALSTAAAVLSLSASEAGARQPVSVTGIVTAAEPDWTGQFFVQDSTGGIFVENRGHPAPAPGDVVRVDGVTHPGAFAPIISEPHWSKMGSAPLPAPRQVRIENLESGANDGERVEVTGTVRTARIEGQRLVVELSVGGNRLQVNARVLPGVAPESLIAARVRVRGTAATHYNVVLRHLTSVAVYVPRIADFTVLEPEREDPFSQPVTPANNIAEYRRGRGAEQRVHVRGTITIQRVGEGLFLQDATGGIRVQSTQPESFPLGAQVDAAGFIEFEHYQPLLRNAVVRRSGQADLPVQPVPVTFADISRGQHHGDLISLQGRLLDRSVRPESREPGNFSGFKTTWLVQARELTFTVEYESRLEDATLVAIPLGSVVRVAGVCDSTVDAAGKLTALKVLLPAPADLQVIQRPSWLTPRRLLIGMALLSAGLLVVVAWLLTVSRKNAILRRLIRELEHAQRELQEAHDTLEQKVAERSAQLQVEMTARKTAELQFKGVLAERTRLARELHDTLEQTLTGIALQLDTSFRLAPRDPAAAREHLQRARSWLQQSQIELRSSIWDLRSRELEQFDLAGALRHSAEQVVEDRAMQLAFHATGPTRSLPEVVEENVLRIGQEALTNIAKHAQATEVAVTLDVADGTLRLQVEDNGRGFQSDDVPDTTTGHYGLTSMTERAKRMGGRLQVASTPGHGTIITVIIPLGAAESLTLPPS